MRILFDLEGNGLRESISSIWCVVVKNLDTEEVTKLTCESPNFAAEVAEVFAKATYVVGHNIINYDLPVLKAIMGVDYSGEILDTLVLSRLLNPDRPYGHSLDEWGKKLRRYKPAHEDWSRFSPEMLHRCVEDVEINYLVMLELEKEMSGHDWSQALRIEQRVAAIMTQQEINGVLFDEKKAREYVKFLDDEAEQLYWKIAPVLGYSNDRAKRTCAKPFDKAGGYSKKVLNLLAGNEMEISGPFSYIAPRLTEREFVVERLISLGWKPVEFTEPTERYPEGQAKLTVKGEPVESLLKWGAQIGKDLALYLTLKRRRSSILNPTDPEKGWLNNLRPDGRLTAGAIPLGAPSGRMHHRLVVNVPKANEDDEHNLIWDIYQQKDIFGTQLRSLFTVPEDRVMVGHDASGIENRMLAHYINDPAFTETIIHGKSSEGTDLHTVLWKTIDEYVHSRGGTKNIEYAYFYGAQDPKLGSMVDYKPKGWSDKKMGSVIRARIGNGVPALGSLTDRVQRAAKRGYLIGLDGRRMVVRSPHAALNTLLQGGATAVMKLSMCYLDAWVRKNNLDVKKVIDMHDEAQAEVLPEHAELYAKLAVQSIIKAGEFFNLRCPLDAEAKIGRNWAETH